MKQTETEPKDIDDHAYSKIEFNKNTLFIRTLPNQIGFDTVTIKNTGKTCVYFKWQKHNSPPSLENKKNDGVDRFFCHYSDSKIFPEEEKSFVFSFFSEKNGLFCEDWILKTSPPFQNCNLNLHLNGMVHLYIDKYSEKIEKLNNEISKNGIITGINEFVLDLVETIQPDAPPKPDMKNEKVFKFYYEYLNKEYNVVYSKKVMNDLHALNDKICECLGYESEDQKFWSGAIDEIKQRIEKVPEGKGHNEMLIEDKEYYTKLLEMIINFSRAPRAEDSSVYNYVRNIILEQLDNFNDIVNGVKEEYLMPPYICDWLTKETLTEQELPKYEAEVKKRRDDYVKKAKKKPFKNQEEEQAELDEYKKKLHDKIKNYLLDKLKDIDKEKTKTIIKNEVLTANDFNEEYIDRLTRVKMIRTIKNEGKIDGKYIVLRIDIENFKREYRNEVDEEGKVIGRHFERIDFMNTKEKVFDYSLNYLLNNGARAVLLLVDMGAKTGVASNENSLKDLTSYIEKQIDHPAFYAGSIEDLMDYNQRIEDEELKDNCCIVMENINFFPEECGFDNYKEEVVNPKGNEEKLCLYYQNKFIQQLTEKTAIYVNDSTSSLDKYYPSVINVKGPTRVIGMKIDEQLKKITNFFSIDSREYLLIVGDNDCFTVSGRDTSTMSNDIAETVLLDYNDTKVMQSTLIIVNSVMLRFKEIFFFGKLGLQFIQFLRKDYTLFDQEKYKPKEDLFQLMKYIIIKAHLNGIKIILPKDFRILDKNEYQRHFEPYVDQMGNERNYMKDIKMLFKRERIQKKLEAANTDEDELNENADYLRVKLEEEEIEQLNLYKEEIVTINRLPYCYDFINEFSIAQGISRPKKMFKTPMDSYLFNESVFDKEIVYPEEIISSSEINAKIEEDRKEKIRLKEEEKKKAEAEALQKEQEEATNKKDNKNPSKTQSEHTQNPPQEEEKKEGEGEGEKNEEEKKEGEEEQKPKEKKPYDPRLYNKEQFELVDYGDASYDALIESINKMNGIMWIGRLSTSKIENMFDNYPKIISAIYERKQALRLKFEEEQATQEKKLNETELKARKQLLNVLLKSNSVYECVKENFKNVLNNKGEGDAIEDLEEEEEIPQDDEQFNHNMHVLIDYYIDDDYELINTIFKGKHIAGFYAVDMEKPIVKEEEFDPKTLEEITN